MRLLVVNWQDRLNPQAGGAEIHLHEVFGRLARRGHEVTLLVSGWKGSARRERVDDMEVHRVGSRYTFNLVIARHYRRHLRRIGHDLLIEDLNKVPVFAPLWAREPVALLVHHLFGTTAFQEASWPLAAATWLLEKPVPHFYHRLPTVAVSRSTADDLVARGFRPDLISVIPNGIDLRFYSPDPAVPRFPDPTLLYLGRLKRYKRVDLVLRAFAQIGAAGPLARLIIAGQGDARPAVEGLVAELGLRDRVEMPGHVSEERKRELFRRTWVHVLTSPKEGWGITNVEAAACGTPTIASDSPGLRDSVIDGITGFLVPHGDVGLLAEKMTLLLQNEALRTRLGEQAQAFAQQYSWDHTADQMEGFLEGAVSGSRSSRSQTTHSH